MYSISNATGSMQDTYTADVSTDSTYTHRASAFHRDGLHVMRLRDRETGEIVSETTAEKGRTFSADDLHQWVFAEMHKLEHK